jgi:hypothetical protein
MYLVVGILAAVALSLVVGWTGRIYWDKLSKQGKQLIVGVNPETRQAEIDYVEAKDNGLIEDHKDGMDVIVDGEYAYQFDEKLGWVVDLATGKSLNVEKESNGETYIERLDGRKLNELRSDMRIQQWHMNQETGAKYLKYLPQLAGFICLTLLAIVGMLVYALRMLSGGV